MSVFDKIKSNPYQSTYIGAPLEEMAQAMAARTARADDFYAREDALEDAFSQDLHFQADDALFNESQSAIRAEIEELAKNPHQNSRRIKSLARQYSNNADLNLGRKNYKAYKDWETKFEEDPTKYGGEITAGLAGRTLTAYRGAASGDALSFDRLYEHKDINETLIKAANTIKDSQNFEQTSDGRFINTITKKYITEQEVADVLTGTLVNDPTIMQQVDDYVRFNGDRGVTKEQYIQQLIQPQVQAIAHADYSSKLTSIPKQGGGSGGGNVGGTSISWQGPSVKSGTHEEFRGKDATEVLDIIKSYEKGTEEHSLYLNEYKEYMSSNLSGLLTDASDRRILQYIEQAGPGELSDLQNGKFEGYKHWQNKTLDYAVELSSSAQRAISSDLSNSWFNRKGGANFGDNFADKYSAGNNSVINNSRQVLQDMGLSGADITDMKDNLFNQLYNQNQVEILNDDGTRTVYGSEEFAEAFTGGELVGFASDSDLTMFKVSTTDDSEPEKTLYIRMPADTFGVTAARTNKLIQDAYGDGTNVNYKQLGDGVMSMNNTLASQARDITNRLKGGNTNIQFRLSDLSPAFSGVGSFERDADGDISFLINGKNMLQGNSELQSALAQAVSRNDASTVAGILASVGQSTNKN